MPYIYENDVTQTGGNLQKTVAYLLSLHKNEYEWNLLGIKVVGHVDALPIPDSDYEYGDAYTVGTTTPYDMWIYTRADATHQQDYWFNVGKFPAPGPQGPAGPSLIDVTDFQMNAVQRVDYDATTGADVESAATLKYKDPNTGEAKKDTIDTMKIKLPILPGKYMSMDANSDNDALEVKVDDIELAQDFIKISKIDPRDICPVIQGGKVLWVPITAGYIPESIVTRDANCNSTFNTVFVERLTDYNTGLLRANMNEIYHTCNIMGSDQIIEKTPTNTGTFSAELIALFQGLPNIHIVYDNQLYYRQDPSNAPDGTLNFIHLDTLQDGEGGNKATGKCFSITVSTRAWQVVDIDFGGTGVLRTTHNLTITNSETGTTIYFSLTNNRPETYEGAPAGLWSALENSSPIACTVDSNGVYSAGMITIDGDNFKAFYGNSEELLMTQDLIGIVDNMI